MAVLTFGITALLATTLGQSLFDNSALPELLKAATPAAALIAAGAAGSVGFLRQRSQEETHDLEMSRHEAELVARLRERYSASAEQLGHVSVAVRLAGVYALAALADDWIARGDRSEAQVCIELLCAYQRVPRPFSSADQDNRAELEVRQTITRVIATHVQKPEDPSSWCGLDFDFTGAAFDGNHNFTGVHFTGGTVNFTNAQFTGGTVNFTNAQFTGGTVNFTNAQFTGGTVNFTNAQFTGGTVQFRWAQFTGGRVNFYSQFTGGIMDFSNAQFTDGRVDFSNARFTGGRVIFYWAKFTGGNVGFTYAQFTGGNVGFIGAEFTGGRVNFTNSQFTGGTADFNAAIIGMDVPGPWGERPLLEDYPSEARAGSRPNSHSDD